MYTVKRKDQKKEYGEQSSKIEQSRSSSFTNTSTHTTTNNSIQQYNTTNLIQTL